MSASYEQDITIHVHTAGEFGLFVNAFLVETPRGVVAIDATLTRSDSQALRARLTALGKPLLAVLITHAHPDHIAGIAELTRGWEGPIIALPSVKALMEQTEQAKHAQWEPIFKDEWIRPWTYPNQLVNDRDVVVFDGITYRIYDLGPGGDCDANAIWVIEQSQRAAFVGDLVFNGMHSYVADGQILGWLANLERMRPLLEEIDTIYPGHGQPASPTLLDQQRDYLLTYCAAIRELAQGEKALTENAVAILIERMERYLPGAPLTFMIGLGANAVATELAYAK